MASTGSVTGSNAPITINGLESGLNTSSIVQALAQAASGAEQVEQNQITNLNSELSAWQSFNTDLLGLQTAAEGLSAATDFSTASATSSDQSVATATATGAAATATHNITVTQLAQAEEDLSGSLSSETTPLNLSGSFSINGTQITINASDDLDQIASAINSANAGVTASVLDISQGDVQLAISANNTGTINAISATDLNGGNVLQSLGLISSDTATSIRQSVTSGTATGAGSTVFSGAAGDVGTLMGMTAGTAPSGTVEINGTSVSINLNTMSLNQIASAINAAGITGVTAQVVAVPNSSGQVTQNSQQQLQITGTNGAITSSSFTDSNGVLAALGIVQSSYTDQASQAKDAKFTMDNVAFMRSSNTVNDVIPNVSLNLQSTGSTQVAVSQNTQSIITAVQNMVSAYNTINDYVTGQNTFTPTSTTPDGTAQGAPPLFGSYQLISIQNQLAAALTGVSNGQTMTSIGITTGTTGDLTVNTAQLTSALQSDPTAVANLFGVLGTASNSAVTFDSATSSTQSSPSGGYPVVVTTPASQASVEAGAAQTGPSTSPETLTFGGELFGGDSFALTIPTGSTQQDIVNLINGNSNLNQDLLASIDQSTGALELTSIAYGSAASFNVSSNQAASATNSGIGQTLLTGTGADVAGTIGGEPATGIGQTLTANSTNQNTAGLIINVAATAPGSYGSVSVTQGVANQLNNLISNFTNSNNGDVVLAENSINSQISSLNTQIKQMQTNVTNYTNQLNTEFANMETALATLKTQSAALDAEVAATSAASTTSSSNSGTSSTGSSSGSSSSSS